MISPMLELNPPSGAAQAHAHADGRAAASCENHEVPISIWVRNWNAERGDRLDESSVAWKAPYDALNLRDTPLLAGVDPYGNTVFNRPQAQRQLPGERSPTCEND